MKSCVWPLIVVGALLSSVVRAAEPLAKSPARQGQATAAERRTATIHWDNVPLRDGIGRLETALACRIFLDRRLDPNQVVSIDVADSDGDEILAAIAAATSLGVSELGQLRYLGPQSAADQLRTLAAVREEEVARLPDRQHTAFERKRKLSWPRLAEPRALIETVIQQRAWQVRSADRIPHDLWPAGSLLELSLADQLTLLLIGFDLTFRLSPQDRAVEIVPLEGPITLRRQYRLRNRDADEAILRQELPESEVELKGNLASVKARVEDHQRLAQLLQDRAPRPRIDPKELTATSLYTLRVQDEPVGNVVRQLGQRLGWSIEFDEQAIRAAGLSINKRVSFKVENANREELLEAILGPAGLTYESEGDRLRITPQAREKSPRD